MRELFFKSINQQNQNKVNELFERSKKFWYFYDDLERQSIK